MERLHLPKDPENVIRYLTNSYGGVGRKTAETLVETLGPRVFEVLANDPDRVRQILTASRADLVLEGWQADLRRRRERYQQSGETSAQVAEAPPPTPAPATSLAPMVTTPPPVAYAPPASSPPTSTPWSNPAPTSSPTPPTSPAPPTGPEVEDVDLPAEGVEARRRGRRTRDVMGPD
jgi:hypothetical protein